MYVWLWVKTPNPGILKPSVFINEIMLLQFIAKVTYLFLLPHLQRNLSHKVHDKIIEACFERWLHTGQAHNCSIHGPGLHDHAMRSNAVAMRAASNFPIMSDKSYMHACIHTYIYTYTHTYIHTHTYTHTYIHTHTYTHTHTYIHYIHTYIHTNMHACMHAYIHTYTHTHTRIHTYIHTYIHTHIHTYIHTYVHTYIHTYIHTLQIVWIRYNEMFGTAALLLILHNRKWQSLNTYYIYYRQQVNNARSLWPKVEGWISCTDGTLRTLLPTDFADTGVA
jgi:hypothetical protein